MLAGGFGQRFGLGMLAGDFRQRFEIRDVGWRF
jgi:hypothetical protein